MLLNKTQNGLAFKKFVVDHAVQYYQDDKSTLARELRWMGIILRRADILPLEDRRVIEKRLCMYDDLMENDPKMQQIRAKTLADIINSICASSENDVCMLSGVAQT